MIYSDSSFTSRLPSFSKETLKVLVIALFGLTNLAYGQISGSTRGYSERFSGNLIGSFEMIGNQNLTCVSNCPANPETNNPSVVMGYVDVDASSSTDNSSMSTLSLPANATVVWAGLYWGGVYSSTQSGINAHPNNLSLDRVRFKTPANSNYTQLNATARNVDNTQFDWSTFMSFVDVTTMVQNGGSGDYYVGDIALVTGSAFTGPNGGWSLVVVYESPTELSRRINVWDGFRFFGFGATDNFTVTGLNTPNSGAFQTNVGYFAFDGEANVTGDFIEINGIPLSNANNPADNTLNGSITNFGSNVTTRNPNYTYNWGVDLDVFDATGTVPNAATTANITLGSSFEGIWSGVFVFSNEVAQPNVTKSFGPNVTPLGVPSTVSLYIENPAGGIPLTGISITDNFPAGMVLAAVPNATCNCGAISNALPGEQNITFTGGSLLPGNQCLFTFDVDVFSMGSYENRIGNTAADFSNDQAIALVNRGLDTLVVVAPLPTTLHSLEAYRVGEVAKIKWKTTSQVDVSHYIVEHRESDSTYQEAGTLSMDPSGRYVFDHLAPSNGDNFYRIKIVDRDGQFDYSVVKYVFFDKEGRLEVYPNPASAAINLKLEEEWLGEALRLEIVNPMGQTVSAKEFVVENTTVTLDISSLPSAYYFLRVIDTKGKEKVARLQKL